MLNQFNASLWGDEAFSAVLSQNPVVKIIEIISRDTSPPLYNLILHFWYQVFGVSETAIRSLSFIFFLLAVLFVYKIGEFLYTRKTGLLAAVLTFLNPFFFIYAFEGRMYSILALGVCASMYFFIKKQWLPYILATIWALYSHHFSIFALFVQGLWFMYELVSGHKKTALNIFKSFIVIFILYLPWLIPLYRQTKMVGGGFWLATPTLIDLRNLIYKYLAEGIRFKSLEKIALYVVFILLILRRWNKNIRKTLFIFSWFTGPILITWLVSQKFQSIFFDRYLLYTVPAAMIITASNRRKISAVFLIALITTFIAIDVNYFFHPEKRPFRDLANYVKTAKKDGDIIINWNSAAHHLWESKYYHILAPIYLPKEDLPYYVGTAQMTDKDIVKTLPANAKRIGVITSGKVDEVVIPRYTKREVNTFGELKFIWHQR